MIGSHRRVQRNHWIALVAVDRVNDPDEPPRVVFHCGWINSDARLHSSPDCSSTPT